VDPDGFGSASFSRIGIGIQGMPIRIRGDPDWYQFQQMIKLMKLYFSPENSDMLSKNTENYDIFALMRKSNNCKLAMS
jgi:hypothetical protein